MTPLFAELDARVSALEQAVREVKARLAARKGERVRAELPVPSLHKDPQPETSHQSPVTSHTPEAPEIPCPS